jgi:pimeloyl-ACP methyl ester carboxylesterase
VDSTYRSCTVEGHDLAYRRLGQGEPMLLVHGITTWSFLWEGLLDRLASRHEVVAVDLLGCGRSAKPLDASYALKDHARRLEKLVEALGLGPVHYLGHDLGGGIGQIMAVRSRQRLRTLTLANTVAYDFWPVQPIIALRTPVVRQLLMATFDLGTFRLVIQRGLFHKEKLTAPLLARFGEPFTTEAGRKGFLHFARCLDNSDLMEISDDLGRLDLPVTVAWGTADVYLSFGIAERLVASIPGSRLERCATAGHFSPLDEPGWLAEVALGTARSAHGR